MPKSKKSLLCLVSIFLLFFCFPAQAIEWADGRYIFKNSKDTFILVKESASRWGCENYLLFKNKTTHANFIEAFQTCDDEITSATADDKKIDIWADQDCQRHYSRDLKTGLWDMTQNNDHCWGYFSTLSSVDAREILAKKGIYKDNVKNTFVDNIAQLSTNNYFMIFFGLSTLVVIILVIWFFKKNLGKR